MAEQNTPRRTGSGPRRVTRDTTFNIRFSPTEKETLEAEVRSGGYASVADLIRDRVFRQPSSGDIRGHQRVDGEFFTDKQKSELAVAVVHQYRIHEAAFEQSGAKQKFDEERRQVIEDLGLGKLLGT